MRQAMEDAGLSSIFTRCRIASIEDIQAGRLPKVVISQDVYHARERIFRKLSRSHRDRRKIMQEIKSILAMASCRKDPQRLVTGSNWDEVDAKMQELVCDLRASLQEVSNRYLTTQTTAAASSATGDVLQWAKRLGSHLHNAPGPSRSQPQPEPDVQPLPDYRQRPMLPSAACYTTFAPRGLVCSSEN